MRSKQHGDVEIYPEVHFPMEARLRWSGAVFTKVKHRCGETRITMLPLRLTTRTFTSMKHTQQVGGSPPNTPSRQDSMLQDRGTHHNSIGGSRQCHRSYQSSEGPKALRVPMNTKSSKPLSQIKGKSNRFGCKCRSRFSLSNPRRAKCLSG